MSVRYSEALRKAVGILKHPVAPHDQWHIDWVIMGQQTLGMNGEAYSLVVLDVGSSTIGHAGPGQLDFGSVEIVLVQNDQSEYNVVVRSSNSGESVVDGDV